MPLFEVAILEKPTNKAAADVNQLERLIFGPKAVIAVDTESAGIVAVLEAKEQLVDVDKSRMKVLVRPFR